MVNCTLIGCTINGNNAYTDGGGAHGSVLTNCILCGNGCDQRGGGAAGGCILSGCVLSNNWALLNGGGAYQSTLRNCAITRNHAQGDYVGNGYGIIDGEGGGAFASLLDDCLLTANRGVTGGGAADCTIANCTIVGNIGDQGFGGVTGGSISNSIVYYNDAPNVGGTASYYSCLPGLAGNGNITNEPGFVDLAAGNYHLAAGSPCINAGTNSAVQPGETDLDGLPRIIGGVVDMGAYESTNGATASGVPWGWLLHYNLATDGSADLLDPDGDRMNDLQEYLAGTDPTNADSVLRFLAVGQEWGGTLLEWKGGRDAWQFLECREDLTDTNEPWIPIIGLPPPTQLTNAVIDMGATNRTLFYRIRAQR